MKLDPSVLSPDAQAFAASLAKKVIGQDRAVKQFVKMYQNFMVGLNKKNRPAGVVLELGPTGVGKTEIVRAAAETLLGTKKAITQIDCAEYQHSHEVSKLIGSPPGYVGYSEKPRLSQDKIDKFQTEKHRINFVLFDEVEKADPTLFAALLGVLDSGRLTLGNSHEVDFSRTFLILTSNLGSGATRKLIEESGIGFKPASSQTYENLDEKIYQQSKAAVEKFFKSEFINRLDRIIVFRSLAEESLRAILKIELSDLEFRVWESPWAHWKWSANPSTTMPTPRSIVFDLTTPATDFLLKEGTSAIYGARELNRAVERFIAQPMASLIGSGQLTNMDKVLIDHEPDAKHLTFHKQDGKCKTKQLSS